MGNKQQSNAKAFDALEHQFVGKENDEFNKTINDLFDKYDKDKSGKLDNEKEIKGFLSDCFDYSYPIVTFNQHRITMNEVDDPKQKKAQAILKALISNDRNAFSTASMDMFDNNKDGDIVKEEFFYGVGVILGFVIKVKY